MSTAAMTQQNRDLSIATELGKDVLLLRVCHGQEQLGRPFEFSLELLSEQPDKVKFDKILGSSATVTMHLPGGGKRDFNASLDRFPQAERDGRVTASHATLAPWMWLLTRTSDCKIYQNQSVPDIITSVFRDQGFSDFKSSLSGSYQPVE